MTTIPTRSGNGEFSLSTLASHFLFPHYSTTPLLRFRIPDGFAPQAVFEHSFYASWGRVPRLTQIEIDGNILTVRPDTRGTGTYHLPLVHKRFGLIVKSTETLMQRLKPYHLTKELARGELGRILRRLFEWEMIGFAPSKELKKNIHDFVRRFSRVAISDELDQKTDSESMKLLYELGDMSLNLSDQYINQMISLRKRDPARFNAVPFGVFVDYGKRSEAIMLNEPTRSQISETFDFMISAPTWKEDEPSIGKYKWDKIENHLNLAEKLGMTSIIGPILAFDPNKLPSSIRGSIDDLESFEIAAIKYTQAIVRKFRKRNRKWILSGRFFSCPDCGFSIGRGVSLICDLAKEVRNLDSKGTIFVGIDQPWGDYYRANDCLLPIVAIVETLASVEQIDGFILEVNLGLDSRSTLPRDPLTLGKLIDLWGIWGKQLYVSLSVPSELGSNSNFPDEYIGSSFVWNSEFQREWAERYVLMLLSKRNVKGIFWNPLTDTPSDSIEWFDPLPHLYYSGLMDSTGRMKPAMHKLTALKKIP